MKKILLILILIVVLTLVLTSCDTRDSREITQSQACFLAKAQDLDGDGIIDNPSATNRYVSYWCEYYRARP